MKPKPTLFSSKLISGKMGSRIISYEQPSAKTVPQPNSKNLIKTASSFRSFGKIFQEIVNNDQYVGQFYGSLFDLFEKERLFIKQCLSGPKDSKRNLRKRLVDNLYVFKENLKLCMPFFLDDFFRGYFSKGENVSSPGQGPALGGSSRQNIKFFKEPDSGEKSIRISSVSQADRGRKGGSSKIMNDLLSQKAKSKSHRFFRRSSLWLKHRKHDREAYNASLFDPTRKDPVYSENYNLGRVEGRFDKKRCIQRSNSSAECKKSGLSGQGDKTGEGERRLIWESNLASIVVSISQSKVTEKSKIVAENGKGKKETHTINGFSKNVVADKRKRASKESNGQKEMSHFENVDNNAKASKKHSRKRNFKRGQAKNAQTPKDLMKNAHNWPPKKVPKPFFASSKFLLRRKSKTKAQHKSGKNAPQKSFSNRFSKLNLEKRRKNRKLYSIFSENKTTQGETSPTPRRPKRSPLPNSKIKLCPRPQATAAKRHPLHFDPHIKVKTHRDRISRLSEGQLGRVLFKGKRNRKRNRIWGKSRPTSRPKHNLTLSENVSFCLTKKSNNVGIDNTSLATGSNKAGFENVNAMRMGIMNQTFSRVPQKNLPLIGLAREGEQEPRRASCEREQGDRDQDSSEGSPNTSRLKRFSLKVPYFKF